MHENWDFKLHINARHLGVEPPAQRFKTDALPPLYHLNIVYIRSNKDIQIANTL